MMLRAADYIREHGLSCGGQVDYFGRKCVVNVLASIQGSALDPIHIEAIRRLKSNDRVRISLGFWSDNTPAAEVIELLERVARER